jgi:hypothetical protein
VELATRACKLSRWKESNYVSTLAATYAEAGNFAKAVQWQEKAITLNKGAGDKKELERLHLYKNKKPNRETG